VIETHDLAVEDGVPNAPERDRDLGGERTEALEGVTVARDEPTLAVLDVGERSKPVELQLEQPVAMVEGIAAALEGERGETREGTGHERVYGRP